MLDKSGSLSTIYMQCEAKFEQAIQWLKLWLKLILESEIGGIFILKGESHKIGTGT